MKLREERTYPARRPRPRRPSVEQFAGQIDHARRSLDVLAQLGPVVMEHIRRGGVRMPAGSEGGGAQPGEHSDPTFAAVAERWEVGEQSDWSPAHARRGEHPMRVVDRPGGRRAVLAPVQRDGGPHEEANGARALRAASHALKLLDLATAALTSDYRAVAAAIAQGMAATDGRTEDEREAQRRGARLARLGTCLACQHPAEQLRSGFCEPCYKSWCRAGRPERSGWIAVRRRLLDQRASERAEVVALRSAEWDPAVNTSIGPADGADRRAA